MLPASRCSVSVSQLVGNSTIVHVSLTGQFTVPGRLEAVENGLWKKSEEYVCFNMPMNI